jgi:hypothetical protein
MRVKVLGSRTIAEATRDLVSRVVRPHQASVRVARQQIPYWEQQGWARQGHEYTGAYRTAHGSFSGFIRQRPAGIDFYLYEPPPQLRRHSHWSCFQEQNDGWYSVHMSRRPADVSSGILAIERLVTEAIEQKS